MRAAGTCARVCGRDDAQGIVAGNFLAKNYKDKKIAIIDDKTPYGKGLADETRKALNAAGVNEAMNEVLYGRREGLHRSRLQAQGSRHRCRLCRRLSHRRRPHPAPAARAGLEGPDDLGRRVQHRRVLDHHRPGRRRHDLDLRARSAQLPGRPRQSSRSSRRQATIRKATRSTPMPRSRPMRRRRRPPAAPTTTRRSPNGCAPATRSRPCSATYHSTKRATSRTPSMSGTSS